MENENSNEYEDLLEILYPGYNKMSDKKKEIIQMKSFDIIRYSKEIRVLLANMKNQESPLYQPNKDDKDLVNIACLYSRIYEESQSVNVPTGKVNRSGTYYDMPEDEYKNVKTSDREQQELIALSIEKYNKNNKIRPKNLISMLRNSRPLELNLDFALEVKKVLDSISKSSLDDHSISDEERS